MKAFLTSILVMLACAACSPREEGLILKYDFSKSEGTVLKDVSGNGYDAALKGSAAIGSCSEGKGKIVDLGGTMISDVRIYNRALSEAEIAEL